MGPAQREAEAHVTRMKVPHSWTVVAKVGVDAVGIEQTVSEQLEHGTSQEDGTD